MTRHLYLRSATSTANEGDWQSSFILGPGSTYPNVPLLANLLRPRCKCRALAGVDIVHDILTCEDTLHGSATWVVPSSRTQYSVRGSGQVSSQTPGSCPLWRSSRGDPDPRQISLASTATS